ncbi:MAG: MFS transporter [Anaerolinea sp.]|nr:MFS transporter [Anaerolinea sp.]
MTSITPRQRITAALFLSQSLFSAAMIAAFTVTPILAAQLSGSDRNAGVPSTFSLVGRALAAYPIGWLMGRVGRRMALSLGYGLAVVGMVMTAWGVMVSSYSWFLLGVTLFGMGRGASEQSRYVAAEVQPLARRAKAIGLIVFAGTVGAVGGPLLVQPSEQLLTTFGQEGMAGPFVLGALLTLVAYLLVLTLLRPDPKVLSQEFSELENGAADGNGRPLWQIFALPPVLLAVAAMTIGQLVMTLIMVITPLYMDQHAHSTQAISWVIMAHTLGMFGLSSVTGWLIDRYGRITLIIVGAAVLILSSILTPLSAALIPLIIALFLLGLGWNFCFVAGSSLLSDSLSGAEKGRTQGAGDVVVALASGAGSLGTGAIFANGGMVAISGVGLAFSLLLMALFVWSGWSRRPALLSPK